MNSLVTPPDSVAAAPKVSIISVFYNRAGLVADTAACLLGQSFRDFELILVDDGSTDGTADEIRKIDDPRVRAVIKENAGFTPSMNQAIALARGQYIAVHGSGDYSYPDRLRQQVEILDANPKMGVVGCKVEIARLGRDEFSVTHADDQEESGRKSFYEMLQDHCIFLHGETMYRKAVFDAVGGYREQFVLAQDYDLWFRMSAVSDCGVVREVLYRQNNPPGTVRASPSKILLQQRFAELARQCARANRQGEADLIARYGAQALDHLQPSRKLGDILVANGVNIMVHVGDKQAMLLVEEGYRISPSLKNKAHYLLMGMHDTPFWPALQAGLRLWRKMRERR